VQILGDQHHRLLLPERQHPGEQRFQRLLALELRAHRERHVALGQPQREQRGQERHALRRLQAHERKPSLQPLELLLGRELGLEAHGLLDQLDQRVEGTVLRVR
jgi:hypothetical protein